jgi:K+-sensing histidine kinase KdpD
MPRVSAKLNMLMKVSSRSRGEDVVIGVVETHSRAGIAELA